MTVRYFTKTNLIHANLIAKARHYNQKVSYQYLRTLPVEGKFPVMFSMLHEHAQGEPVDPHVRCLVMTHPDKQILVDCDLQLFNDLDELDLAPKGG